MAGGTNGVEVATPRTTTGDNRAISAFKLKILWSLLIAAISMAGGSMVVAAKGLYNRGAADAERDLTVKALVDHKIEYERRVRALEDEVLKLKVQLAFSGAGQPNNTRGTPP